jgi:formiminotetrahydrofolate cyclodeaminase
MSESIEQDLRQMPLAEFIEQAAARTPTPGGGSIAAVAGALGTAMMAMSANFTTGEKFADVAEEIEATLSELGRARGMFLELMNEDTKAFSSWQAAYRMDKNDPERAEAMKVASLAAITVPREMATLCLSVLGRIAKTADKVNKRLLSDVGVAAVLVESAMRAAHYNVRVNLSSLESEDEAAELRQEMADQIQRAANLLKQVDAKLAGNL